MRPIPVILREPVPWKIYGAIAFGLVAGPYIFYLWNSQYERVPPGTPGWAPNAAVAARTESQMVRLAAHAPVTDALVILAERDPRNLAGQPVLLARAGVRRLAGEGAFWAGHVGTPPVLVVSKTRVAAGDAVLVTGTVRQAESQGRWPGLGENGLYVEADNVEVLGRF